VGKVEVSFSPLREKFHPLHTSPFDLFSFSQATYFCSRAAQNPFLSAVFCLYTSPLRHTSSPCTSCLVFPFEFSALFQWYSCLFRFSLYLLFSFLSLALTPNLSVVSRVYPFFYTFPSPPAPWNLTVFCQFVVLNPHLQLLFLLFLPQVPLSSPLYCLSNVLTGSLYPPLIKFIVAFVPLYYSLCLTGRGAFLFWWSVFGHQLIYSLSVPCLQILGPLLYAFSSFPFYFNLIVYWFCTNYNFSPFSSFFESYDPNIQSLFLVSIPSPPFPLLLRVFFLSLFTTN